MTATVVGPAPGASEATAAAILAAVVQLEAVGLGATEATATAISQATGAILAAVDGVEALLGRLPGSGAASEATLGQLQAIAEAIQTSQEATRVAAEDSARQVTAEGILAAIDGIEPLAAQIRDGLGPLATEAKLEAVRALLAAGVGVTVANPTDVSALAREATAQTIRDTILRRTDPLPAGANLIGYVSPSVALKAGLGRFFIATSGRVTLSLAGNLRATIANPAGSGKSLYVVRLAGLSTATGWAQLFVNPTAGLPATAARPTLNAIAGGGNAAAAVMRVDTSTTTPLSGGTDPGVTVGIGASNRFAIDLPPLIVAPGVTLGINVPFTGAADAELALHWFEE